MGVENSTEIIFTLLIYGATLNKRTEHIINKQHNNFKSDLKNCLTEFEKIKAMPHLGQLIGTYKKSAKAILKYINNETDQNKLIEECQSITEKYGSDEQLSFIPGCLLNMIQNVINNYIEEIKIKVKSLLTQLEEVVHGTQTRSLDGDGADLYDEELIPSPSLDEAEPESANQLSIQ